ncbi:unnamed protein product, partial [Ectocarpus sp. 12 AP-2014]
ARGCSGGTLDGGKETGGTEARRLDPFVSRGTIFLAFCAGLPKREHATAWCVQVWCNQFERGDGFVNFHTDEHRMASFFMHAPGLYVLCVFATTLCVCRVVCTRVCARFFFFLLV